MMAVDERAVQPTMNLTTLLGTLSKHIGIAALSKLRDANLDAKLAVDSTSLDQTGSGRMKITYSAVLQDGERARVTGVVDDLIAKLRKKQAVLDMLKE